MNIKKFLLSIITLIFISLLGLFVLSGYYAKQPITMPQPTQNKSSHKPSASATDVLVTNYDKHGDIEYVIKAPYIEYHTASDKTIFQKPHIHTTPNQADTWQITANTAIAHENNDIKLNDDVRITKAKTTKHDKIFIFTDSLRYLPDEQMMHGEERVKLTTGGHQATAVGFEVHFETEDVRLLSDTRLSYDQ